MELTSRANHIFNGLYTWEFCSNTSNNPRERTFYIPCDVESRLKLLATQAVYQLEGIPYNEVPHAIFDIKGTYTDIVITPCVGSDAIHGYDINLIDIVRIPLGMDNPRELALASKRITNSIVSNSIINTLCNTASTTTASTTAPVIAIIGGGVSEPERLREMLQPYDVKIIYMHDCQNFSFGTFRRTLLKFKLMHNVLQTTQEMLNITLPSSTYILSIVDLIREAACMTIIDPDTLDLDSCFGYIYACTYLDIDRQPYEKRAFELLDLCGNNLEDIIPYRDIIKYAKMKVKLLGA